MTRTKYLRCIYGLSLVQYSSAFIFIFELTSVFFFIYFISLLFISIDIFFILKVFFHLLISSGSIGISRFFFLQILTLNGLNLIFNDFLYIFLYLAILISVTPHFLFSIFRSQFFSTFSYKFSYLLLKPYSIQDNNKLFPCSI